MKFISEKLTLNESIKEIHLIVAQKHVGLQNETFIEHLSKVLPEGKSCDIKVYDQEISIDDIGLDPKLVNQTDQVWYLNIL